MKKSLLIPALALTMVGTVLFATQTFAQDTNSPHATLVQHIAEKFNLNKDDVQKVFDEERANRESAQQTKFASRLDQYAKDGKITDAQKKLILDKMSSMNANRAEEVEKLKSMTPDQRNATIKAQKDELKTWAKNNGIDLKSLLGVFSPGIKHFEKSF